MQKSTILIVVMAVVIVVLAVVLMWSQPTQPQPIVVTPTPTPTPQVFTGLVVTSPQQNQTIASPLKIEGYVNGDGWIGFEAQVGTVKLFNSNNVQLASGILTAKGEWMQVKIDFETTITFANPQTATGYLRFYNENPSGDPQKDKTFDLPVTF